MGGNESSNPLNDLNNSPMIPSELMLELHVIELIIIII